MAKGDGAPRVYLVEPTGAWEDDPNVTDKKFSRKSDAILSQQVPTKNIGEVKDWVRQKPEQLRFGENVWRK